MENKLTDVVIRRKLHEDSNTLSQNNSVDRRQK